MQIEYSQNQSKAPEFAIYKQSNVEKENERTPDLSGGAESAVRTSAHNPSTSDRVFRHGNPSRKQAALTFDDGPDMYFTTRILNILKEHGIHATFFIMGKRADAHPEIVRRIVSEGHAIGNHTWDHPNLTKLEPGKIKDEINKTEQKLDKIVGYHPSIFRPPYGSASPSVIREISAMGYYTIDWSVDTRDWAGTPPSQIMKYLKSELGPGGIILQHCAGGKGENLTNTLNALPQIISYMKQNGYKFVTIPEMLNVPAAKK
ncbi:MAG TPA: polysaccharide deacetylase family protein [Clostridia bacterium]